jgi:hypothetical protein
MSPIDDLNNRTEDLAQTLRVCDPLRGLRSRSGAPRACLPVYRLRVGERRWSVRLACGCIVR